MVVFNIDFLQNIKYNRPKGIASRFTVVNPWLQPLPGSFAPKARIHCPSVQYAKLCERPSTSQLRASVVSAMTVWGLRSTKHAQLRHWEKISKAQQQVNGDRAETKLVEYLIAKPKWKLKLKRKQSVPDVCAVFDSNE